MVAACLLTAAPAHADVPAACMGGDEAAVACLVNEARESVGLRRLRYNADLTEAAQRYARRMAVEDFFSHVDPQGDGPAERLVDGYGSRFPDRSWSAGEALAAGTGAWDTPQGVVYSWLASPSHRRILLGRSWKHFGIGISGGSYVFYAGRR
jgi:uncharacterized protein YkwD